MQVLNEFTFGLWRGCESAMATKNETLRHELVRTSAAFAGSIVVASHFRFLAQNPTFSAYASEVVSEIEQTDPSGVDAMALYDAFREHNQVDK